MGMRSPKGEGCISSAFPLDNLNIKLYCEFFMKRTPEAVTVPNTGLIMWEEDARRMAETGLMGAHR